MFSHCILTSFFSSIILVNGFDISLVHDGPIVLGSTIQFWAQVDNGFFRDFKYEWKDNAPKPHSGQDYGKTKYSWNVTYPKDEYHPGEYEMDLTVCEKLVITYLPCVKKKVSYNVTADLNGGLKIFQNSSEKTKPFVSNDTEVDHLVTLKDTDLIYIEDNNYTTASFWFMNCTYLGFTSDLKLRYNYTTADEDFIIKSVVVAAKLNETTNITEVFTDEQWPGKFLKPNNSTEKDYVIPWPDGSCKFPFIPKDPDKLYGYFIHEVKPRRPVKVASVVANNWLKNGDLLNATVTFTGSLPYYHCIQFIMGEYNATGNESCLNTQKTTTGKINVVHYFGSGEKHTVLFIIENSVSKTVPAVIVTNYNAKKHPQLSVIIVPISCSAVAIILIVFGVAFYIQSKKRYTVEVADFDFTANNDTEYKSFRDRLREAVSSAFTRVTDEEQEEAGPYWSPSRKIPNKPRLFENSDSDTPEN